MENKIFKFIENDFKNNFEIQEDTTLDILGIFKSDSEIILNINIKENVKFKLNFTYLCISDSSINVKINPNHFNSNSLSDININVLSLDESTSKNTINTFIESKTINNKVNQSIVGIMISANSNISGMPNLEINTDNVLATHSLNIGNLNQEELFYLNSKGFSSKQSKKMLLQSLIDSCLSSLSDEENKKYNRLLESYF